jgi:hypothetical protein
MAGNQPALEHDPEKWIPVFGKRSCSEKDDAPSKKLERDDGSKRSHPALGLQLESALVRRRKAGYNITYDNTYSSAKR